MSHLRFVDPSVRLRWLRTITACGFIAGLLLSPRLWLSSRSFPPAPVSDRLSLVPFPLDYAWFGLLLALLGASIFVRRPRPYLVGFVVLVAVYTLWDQARWTPWVYQYAAILAVLSFHGPGSADARRDAVLNSCRVISATTYFWADWRSGQRSEVRYRCEDL